MKIVVTGGAGFIGSHLAEKLSTSNNVTIIDDFSTGHARNLEGFIDDVRIVEADISTQGPWMNEFEGKDICFHLAAKADVVPSIEMPRSYFETNVTGTLNVLEACRQAPSSPHVVYAASSSCYGLPDSYPTNEETPVAPEYPYAMTKYMAEELLLHYAKVYDLPVTSARLFNVYGPRARTSGTYGAVMGVFFAQFLANEPLTVVGDGSQSRDFVYVTDVVEALIALASREEGPRVYNVGTGHPRTVLELAQLISSQQVRIPWRPGEPHVTHADISRITQHTDWGPRTSLEEGIRITSQDIQWWADAPVWTPKSIAEATETWFLRLGEQES